MSIFSRIFKIGQAHANKVVEGMEKPEVMLDQAIRDKEKQIREAKQSIQAVIATERQAKAQFDKESKEKSVWEQKAEAAMRAGKEELAVKALQRSTEHEQKSKALEVSWTQQRAAVDEVKKDIMKMDDEIAEFKRNKDFIIAQSKTAEVKKSIYEAKAKTSKKHDADDLMARMKAKAERTSHEADAAKEMAETFDGSDSLDKEFEDLGSAGADPAVQDKLAALKAKLGNG